MNVEVLLRSYHRDLEWCWFALKSIKKHCRGFSGVTLLVADYDRAEFFPLSCMTTADGAPVRLATYPGNRAKPMMECMAQLCYSDKYCPDADFILHDDSDCVFKVDVTPQTYFTNGKPQLLVRTFESLIGQPPMCWRDPTSNAIGFLATHETMVRHPAVYPRELYGSLRSRVQEYHHVDFHDYVMRFPNVFPWGFAEFPALGMWALHAMPEKFHIIDVSGMQEDKIGEIYKTTLYQGWTHFSDSPGDIAAKNLQRRQFEVITA